MIKRWIGCSWGVCHSAVFVYRSYSSTII